MCRFFTWKGTCPSRWPLENVEKAMRPHWHHSFKRDCARIFMWYDRFKWGERSCADDEFCTLITHYIFQESVCLSLSLSPSLKYTLLPLSLSWIHSNLSPAFCELNLVSECKISFLIAPRFKREREGERERDSEYIKMKEKREERRRQRKTRVWNDFVFVIKFSCLPQTPLHCAAYNGFLECVKVLLQYKANASAKDVGNLCVWKCTHKSMNYWRTLTFCLGGGPHMQDDVSFLCSFSASLPSLIHFFVIYWIVSWFFRIFCAFTALLSC